MSDTEEQQQQQQEDGAAAPAVFRSRRPKANFRAKRDDASEAQPEQPEQQQGDAQQQQDDGKDPDVQRVRLEETKLLHKLRRRHGGTTASALAQAGEEADLQQEAAALGAHQDELRLGVMEGFSKAKVLVQDNVEDKNMQAFVEAELARRLGKHVDGHEAEDPETRRKRLEAEMYKIPDEFKSSLVGDTVVPGMTGLITEVAISSDARLRNIEAVENMKKRMLAGGQEEVGRQSADKLKRKAMPMEFGKQAKRPELTREELEEQRRRMKVVTERRPAVPLHKLPQK